MPQKKATSFFVLESFLVYEECYKMDGEQEGRESTADKMLRRGLTHVTALSAVEN